MSEAKELWNQVERLITEDSAQRLQVLFISYAHFQAKSMAQYLDLADKLFFYRKERFQERFLDDLIALVNTVVTEIILKSENKVKLLLVYWLFKSLGFWPNLEQVDRSILQI